VAIVIPTTVGSPWASAALRVFISHASAQAKEATQLRTRLNRLGCDAFVAHKDIAPGTQWITEIRTALNSCDGLVALVSDEFKDSKSCEQEVGWVLGRDVPVVPVRMGLTPYGLLGAIQACKWSKSSTTPATDLASDVINIFLNDARTAAKTLESMITGLENADSFVQANTIAKALVDLNVLLTKAQLRRLKAAQKSNDQVAGAYNVGGVLNILAKRVGD
jgi:hypothetical protein